MYLYSINRAGSIFVLYNYFLDKGIFLLYCLKRKIYVPEQKNERDLCIVN